MSANLQALAWAFAEGRARRRARCNCLLMFVQQAREGVGPWVIDLSMAGPAARAHAMLFHGVERA